MKSAPHTLLSSQCLVQDIEVEMQSLDFSFVLLNQRSQAILKKKKLSELDNELII